MAKENSVRVSGKSMRETGLTSSVLKTKPGARFAEYAAYAATPPTIRHAARRMRTRDIADLHRSDDSLPDRAISVRRRGYNNRKRKRRPPRGRPAFSDELSESLD